MLHAVDLSVDFDRLPHPLFRHLNLSLAPGDKVALVGANGSGKSTLLNLFTGKLAPTEGRVIVPPNCNVVKLDQNPEEPEEESGEYRRNLALIGLNSSHLITKWQELSSGERMRMAIAAALARQPDVLLLDEPTNHLDIDAKEWILRFLAESRIAIMFATHDRQFADRLATKIVELERGEHRIYAGGYTELQEQKQRTSKTESAGYERQVKEVRRLKNSAEATLQRAAQMTKAPKNADHVGLSRPHYNALQKKLDKRAKAIRSRVAKTLEVRAEKPFEADIQSLRFPAQPIRDAYAVQVRDVYKSFGEKQIIARLSFDVEATARLALLGPNGAGKTTLLRILAGELGCEDGEIAFGRSVQMEFLTQEPPDCDPGQSLLEYLEPDTQEEETQLRSLLGRLGLRGEKTHQRMGSISMGERSRVELVRVLMSKANLLLLDEPTNHLDIQALTALEEALGDYPGAVVFSSHDGAFIERIATERLML